ncbi:MAG: hypothetical protein ACO38W_00385, partial [Phycisphaerales bacterium]
MPIVLLLILLLAPAAIADPPPTATPTVDPTDATTPAQDAAAEPDPPAKAEDEADDAASLEASDRPSRVYLIVDRHTELGGRLVGETADEIVIEHEGEEKAFPKARILSIIPLVEPAPG